MVRQFFVDMDGVLADFDTHHENVFGLRPNKQTDNIVDWSHVNNHENFFSNIPPMPDMRELWEYVSVYQPIILTGVPKSVQSASNNKESWVRKHLGPDIEIRCCLSKEKCLHANPGDILVDDWTKYQHLWLAKGGVWITHTSARDTIEQLQRMGL